MIYFYNAATTKTKPQQVIDAVVEAMKTAGNASRGVYNESLSSDRIIFKEKKQNLYVTFFTSAEAMATEAACRENGIEVRLVPVPRSLSTGCGVSWMGNVEDREKTVSLLEKGGIEYDVAEIL